jgi:hypothetical protein
MSLDLALYSLHRLNGQDLPNLPGLLAVMPPRRAARGREREALIVSLVLSGNTPFPVADYMQLTNAAASAFYRAPGSLTSALRVAAEAANNLLLERNFASASRGQYALGSLILAALRDTQLTLLQSGQTHALVFRAADVTRLHDPARSGKGIGLSPTFNQYYSQVALQPGDRLLFCHAQNVPPAWENALATERGLQPMETARKRMMSLAQGDLHAALAQATEGKGSVAIARLTPADARSAHHSPHPTPPGPGEAHPPRVPAPEPAKTETPRAEILTKLPRRSDATPAPAEQNINSLNAAHIVGRPPENEPSAYAIPPQPPADEGEALVEELAEMALQQQQQEREFPPSIPRLPSLEAEPGPPVQPEADVEAAPAGPRVPSETTRRAAQVAVNAIHAWRRASEKMGASLRRFLPRLLPDAETESPAPASLSGATQVFIAIAVPVLVAVIAFVFYLRLGRSASYESYLAKAEDLARLAQRETHPLRQLEAWKNVIGQLDQADTYGGATPRTSALRQEAQSNLDRLLGISRLGFLQAFNPKLDAQVSRMAANESDLFMLDAASGRILRAAVTPRGYELDLTFQCAPGDNGGTEIGSMVDLLIPPKPNLHNAIVIGVDAAGRLLYCTPGQVAHPETLPKPIGTWERVTAITMDNLNRLYILDASTRGVWVYDSWESTITYPDDPYFYFDLQVPEIRDAIDLSVSGNEMYLLHSDGRLTQCNFRRSEELPTRCNDVTLSAPDFLAYGGTSAFAGANLTQMTFAAPPENALLLLDAQGKQVFRVNLKSFALQGIFGMSGDSLNLASGPVTAMSVSANHVLYLAFGNQVYYSTNLP